MNEQFWWYVTRASGMVAAVLLALTVIWGLLISSRLIERRGLPAWLTDLHRHLGALSAILIGVHLVALVADNTVAFGWSELFVPFASSWKAGPVAWGIGAFWALVIVEGSSLLQRKLKLKRKSWHRLHMLSYPVALMAAIHASAAGTDAANPVFRTVSITLILLIGSLTVFRILHRRPARTSGAARAMVENRPDARIQNLGSARRPPVASR
ncbi:MAG: ferric reductase-like transmembrane domain-containing protein [Microthrixaceae bacterium]